MLAGLRAEGPTASPAPAESAPDPDEVYDAAKTLFDQYAPPEVKEQYDFPSRAQFMVFAKNLQAALDGDSMEDLAKNEPEARSALAVLRASPETAEYADWLAPRLDEISAAKRVVEEKRVPQAPRVQAPQGTHRMDQEVPYYDLWYRRLKDRPPPSNAPAMMPRLREAFAAEGVPPELAWMAEVESSLNPNAHNPSGARGLYQLKADTAKGLGLSTFLPDQRTDPEKSAHAAARNLKALRERFGSWPLAIAAYNAGAGSVGRALASRRADSYLGAASALPAGTRIYVPEVLALIAVRTGRTLD